LIIVRRFSAGSSGTKLLSAAGTTEFSRTHFQRCDKAPEMAAGFSHCGAPSNFFCGPNSFAVPFTILPMTVLVLSVPQTPITLARRIVKGDPKAIAVLNQVLKAELTAINQYFLHGDMCENWGYEQLAKHTRAE